MSQIRFKTALRLLLEGVVVVISILAAFFLEGWGAEREAARDLRQELVSVARELERNRELVMAELDAIDRIVAGTDQLLADLEAAPRSGLVSVNDSIAWMATVWTPTLDPSLGAVDALIASGRLARIEDGDLRLRLAGLGDMLVDASEEQFEARRITAEQVQPQVLGSPDWSTLRRVTRTFLGARPDAGLSPQEQMVGGGMPTFGNIEYPNSASIRGALYLRLAWYEAAIAELEPLVLYLRDLSELAAREGREGGP